MVRLPQPGGDANVWGEVLNEYLSVEHASDGTLKKAADIAQAVQDASDAQAAVATLSSALPTGGTTGQVLTKASVTDRDTTWATPGLGYVDVVTGSESRPANTRVIWIGGTVQPVNMQNLDVWLKES